VQYKASVGSRFGHQFPFEVVRRDDEIDLALIAFPDVQKWSAIEAGESKNVPADARLFVLGFPRSSDLASAEGLLSNHYGPKGKWQTTLPIDYGNSGGPVFDIGGRVIGIAAGGLDEARAMTYVIPFDYARPLRSMVALMNPTIDVGKSTVGAAFETIIFPFSISVDHEEKKQALQEFCLPENSKLISTKSTVTSIAGFQTKLVSVTPDPKRPNCVQLNAYVAGNGVDRVGPIIVNHKGRGWLSGDIEVQYAPP
jgi:hypothetical protein